MKHRLLIWIIVMSAATPMVGVAAANGITGGTTGRVEGLVTLDGKPVKGWHLSLDQGQGDPVGRHPAGKRRRQAKTDRKGRFTVKALTPGRYTLGIHLGLYPGSHGNPACTAPGYDVTVADPAPYQPVGLIHLVSVVAEAPFAVKPGKTVTRNIKLDCEPDGALIPPPTKSKSTATTTPTTTAAAPMYAPGTPERTFLDQLRAAGLTNRYPTEAEAVRAGQQICEQLRNGGQLDLTKTDVAIIVIPIFCPEFRNLIQVYPTPS